MLTLEQALDILRTEGIWGEGMVSKAYQPAPKTKVGPPGRFVNRCDRCLDYTQAARVDMGRQRAWLCAQCSGPNPKVVVPVKEQTLADMVREQRKAIKAEEKEKRRLEREARREAKARDAELRRLRRGGSAKRKPKDPLSEGS